MAVDIKMEVRKVSMGAFFGILILWVLLPQQAFGETTTSENARYNTPITNCPGDMNETPQSSPAEREQLLLNIQGKLKLRSQKALKDLKTAAALFDNCTSTHCLIFRNTIQKTVEDQVSLAKTLRAITMRPRPFLGGTRSPRNLRNVLARIHNDRIRPSQIANFDISGFDFSEQDKRDAQNLWSQVFLDTVAKARATETLPQILNRVQMIFRKMSTELFELNPLLVFTTEDSLNAPDGLSQSFAQLIQFNEEFIESVDGFQTHHETSWISYPNLTLKDHEMGLLNFPNITNELLAETSNPREHRRACRAVHDLVTQKKRRTWSSIAVGFTTATVCAVGVWSGIGAAALAPRCAFAIADGAWGARRGYLDAKIAHHAFYSGRTFSLDGQFSKGILNDKDSLGQKHRAQVVLAVNILGIAPVLKAVAVATKSGRGALGDLVKLPSADVMVSSVESKAASIGYAIVVLRSGELIRDDLQADARRLIQKASGNTF